MKTLLIQWLVSILAILIASYLIPGAYVSLLGAAVLAIVLGVINLFIKPVLNLITLPLNILTLGLFSLIINTILIILAAKIIEDFDVAGFWSAFFFSIVLSLINAFFGVSHKKILKDN